MTSATSSSGRRSTSTRPTAQITAVSDPLPQILEGIPLRLRSIRVNLDRPDFALNPTNCDPFAVGATIFGDEGARGQPQRTASRSPTARPCPSRRSCRLKLTRRRSSAAATRRSTPCFTASSRAKRTRQVVSVALPHGRAPRQRPHRQRLHAAQFAAEQLPGRLADRHRRSEHAAARKAARRATSTCAPTRAGELPDLVADLEGPDRHRARRAGRHRSRRGGLRTTFETVPDAPVSSFTLDLLGGAKGLLQNSKSLCGKPKKANVKMIGQNGVVSSAAPSCRSPAGPRDGISATTERARTPSEPEGGEDEPTVRILRRRGLCAPRPSRPRRSPAPRLPIAAFETRIHGLNQIGAGGRRGRTTSG